MDSFFAFRFVMGCIEETIKSIFKHYDIELFKKVLKKNIYYILNDDNWEDGIREIMDKVKIDYNFGNNDDVTDEEKEKYLEDIDNLLENGEQFEVFIDIPIGNIIEAIKRMVERGDIILDYEMRDVLKDTSLIEKIWDEWEPVNEFESETKNMVNYVIENLESEEI